MRSISTNIQNAIINNESYRVSVRATVEPSRIYFDALTSGSSAWSGAEAMGWIETPVVQALCWSAGTGLVTFYLDGTTLKYAVEGNSTPVSTSYVVTSTINIVDDKLYGLFQTYGLSQATINFSSIASRSPDPFTSVTSMGDPGGTAPGAVCGISAGTAAMLYYDDGGYCPVVLQSLTRYTHPNRFMFPYAINYTSGSNPQLIDTAQAIKFSTALQLGSNIFIYMSNLYDGTVQGVSYNVDSGAWSDVFVAVPTEKENSLCETRIVNSFVRNGIAYLVVQFRRTENIDDTVPYTMILSSTNGYNYAIDRFSLVSNIGYRFCGLVANSKLYLANCNRQCSSDLVYSFNGTSGSGHLSTALSSPGDILSFSDNSLETASMSVAAGNELFMYNSAIQEESRVKVYLRYYTAGGIEEVLYATYIIDSLQRSISDGSRTLELSLVSESNWKLSGLSSPYYTEIFSKSSIYAALNQDDPNLYVAEGCRRYLNWLSVDFFNFEAYEDTGNGITGIEPTEKGKIGNFPSLGAHKVGYRTVDLQEALGLSEYPTCTSGSLSLSLYGWSHTESGTVNDTINVVLFLYNPDTKADYTVSSSTGRFPNTYPSSAAGSYPLVFTITGLTAKHELRKIGVVAEADHPTDFLIARADITVGIQNPMSFDDGNTPWESTLTKGFRLPGYNRPYVMFAQKPFDAWNFQIAAHFDFQDLRGGIASYPQSVGLVGLAKDGTHYICGRYNLAAGTFQIVKVDGAIETILTSGSSSVSISGDVSILFEHRDGTFRVYALDGTTWVQQVSYRWSVTNGWMFDSYTIARKTGIVGNLSAPWFQIVGFDPVESSVSSSGPNSEGIPHLPGFQLADWPTSGSCRIDDTVFAYSGKIACSLERIRGPYQFRNNGDGTGGTYVPPYGIGKPGIEYLDFDWTHSASDYDGYLIALDDGSNYIVSGMTWQCWNSTNGARLNLTNRARAYSNNKMIGQSTHFTQNRAYLTGGLTGVMVVKGENHSFGRGDMCHYHILGDVYCRWFFGSSGNTDVTVRDLIERISDHTGARSQFSGDTVYASIASGSFSYTSPQGNAEGADLHFTTTADFVAVSTNVGYGSNANMELGLDFSNGNVFVANGSHAISEIFPIVDTFASPRRVRILLHDNFATLYCNDRWIYTFSFASVVYPETLTLEFVTSGYAGVTAFTATNLRVTELSDWREAIYIDLESDGKSAISNVIQERPVEAYCKPDGKIDYWYDKERDVVGNIGFRSHRWGSSMPRDGASDAIVQGVKDVRSLQYPEYAKRFGFATKVLRLSNLNSGTLRAGRVILRRMVEGAVKHQLQTRPDARIEPGDEITVSYTASATGRVVLESVIVESVDFSIGGDSASSSMEIGGREAL